MMRLRCTRRLLDHFHEEITPELRIAAAELFPGDWYANIVRYDLATMALCVNEHTRYAIVVPLMDCESITCLYIRLAQRIYDAVRRVCGMEEAAGRILDEYRGGVLIARTNNRSILGTMRDLAEHLELA